MKQTRKLLRERGLEEYWATTVKCVHAGAPKWRELVYEQVEEHYEQVREQHCAPLASAARYMRVKCWEEMDTDRAVMTGEVGMRGSLVVERYLDDVRERLGCRLKLMCRAGCLPVMSRVAWELDLNATYGTCPLCATNTAEDITHVLLHCPAHQRQRAKMMDIADRVLAVAKGGLTLSEQSEEEQVCVLLGARAGGKEVEDIIDVQVKRFLVKAWKNRSRVSAAINAKLGRQDVTWAKRWDGRPGPKSTKDEEPSASES